MPLKKTLLTIFMLGIAVGCLGQCTEEYLRTLKKSAFIVGENKYPDNDLKNPVNDAVEIAKAFRRLGFKTTLDTNVNLVKMRTDVAQWTESLRNNVDIAFFYFAGHGAQIDGINYLYPAGTPDSQIKDVVLNSTYSATILLQQILGCNPKISIIVLDACRNDPTRAFKKSFRRNGLKEMHIPYHGVLIGYPVLEGQTVPDGNGDNSIYAKALLNNIDQPNVSIRNIFAKIQDDVERMSDNTQTPLTSSTIGAESDICLKAVNLTKQSKDFFQNPIVSEGFSNFRKKNENGQSDISEDSLDVINRTFTDVVRKAITRVLDSLGRRFTYIQGGGPPCPATSFRKKEFYVEHGVVDVHYSERLIVPISSLKMSGTEITFTIATGNVPNLEKFELENSIDAEIPIKFSLAKQDWAVVYNSILEYFFSRRDFLLTSHEQ